MFHGVIHDNLVLLLALKFLEVSLSLVFGFHFSNLLQIIILNQGVGETPPSQSNYMDP